jgi:hypothetical protein
LHDLAELSTLAVVFRQVERAPAVAAFLEQMRKSVKAS